MKICERFSDDELIYLIRQQKEEAMELLFFRYKINQILKKGLLFIKKHNKIDMFKII